MENKTTIELLQEFEGLTDKDYESGGKYEQLMEVLKGREPFAQLFNEVYEESIPQLAGRIEQLEDTVKLLKRHKHDTVNNDVLIRI